MRIKTNDKYNSIMLKKIYENACHDIKISAKLNMIYFDKRTTEIINTKINNQLNSMEISIDRINPKFAQKSKNYEKVKEEMTVTLDNYEKSLKFLCNNFDLKLQELILKKVELESKLLMTIISLNYLKIDEKIEEKNTIAKGIDTVVKKIKGKASKNKTEQNNKLDEKSERIEFIKRLEKEIKNINNEINDKCQEKEKVAFDAMETEEKEISTEIRKPRAFKKIKRFFVNKFNTYNVIMKNVIEPLNQRIAEFKVNKLEKIDINIAQLDIQKIENEIKEVQNKVLDDTQNKLMRKKLEI